MAWSASYTPVLQPPPPVQVPAAVLVPSPTAQPWSPRLLPLPPAPPEAQGPRRIVRLEDLADRRSFLRGRRYLEGRGKYRVFNSACYELWRSLGSAPDWDSDTPFATASSLPDTPADVYADGVWYLALTYNNGVIRSGFYPVGREGEPYHVITVSGGVALATPPTGAVEVALQLRASGVVRVVAYYIPFLDGDTNRADEWSLAVTYDGSAPAEDTPDVTQAMTKSGASEALVYDLPAQANGTTVKVRVQTRREDAGPVWVYSDGSSILTATADAAGPAAPGSADAWPGLLPEEF